MSVRCALSCLLYLLFPSLAFPADDTVVVVDSIPAAGAIVPAAPRPSNDPAPVEKIDSTNSIIVSARRYAKFTPSQRVIEAKDFSGKYQDLQSVLETVSGVTVRSMGGFGHYAEVSLRGSSSSQVQVNLDGIPLNGATGDAVDISKIPLASLQKLAVYKNAPPIEFFGENAGGVINLSTAPGKEVTSAGMEVGSFGFRQGGALICKTAADITHRITVNYAAADNNYPYLNNNGTPYNPGDDKTEYMDNNSFSTFSSQYANAWAIDSRQKLTSQISTQVNNEGIFYFPQADSNDGSINTSSFSLVERYETAIDSGLRLIITAKGRVEKELFQRFRPFYLYVPPIRNITRQPFAGTECIVEKNFGERILLRWVVSGSYDGYSFTDTYLPSSAFQPSFGRVSGKTGCEASFGLPAGVSARIGGIYKYETDSTNGRFNYSGFLPGGQRVSNGAPAGFSEISYQASQDVLFLAGIRSSTRNPGFSEKFSMGADVVGNADLRPESRVEYDCGVSVNKPWLSSAASVFGSSTRDKILYQMNAQHMFVPQNMERVTGWGVENDINLYPCRYLSVCNAGAYMENISHTGVAGEDGKDEPLLPRFTDDLGVRIDIQKYYFIHRAGFSSPYYLGLSNIEKVTRNTPELGLTAGCRPSGKIELLYRLENYLDVRNYDFRGQPSPGRRHCFVFKYKF